jgi:hypothetical protein
LLLGIDHSVLKQTISSTRFDLIEDLSVANLFNLRQTFDVADVGSSVFNQVSLHSFTLLHLGQPLESSFFGFDFFVVEELVREDRENGQSSHDHEEVLVSAFGVGRYPPLELVETKTLHRVGHVALLDLDFDFIDVADCPEGTVEHMVLLVFCGFFREDSVVSKVLGAFAVVHGVLFRIRSHGFSLIASVQPLGLHQALLHLDIFEGLLNYDEFLLRLLQVKSEFTLESFLSGWNSLASL